MPSRFVSTSRQNNTRRFCSPSPTRRNTRRMLGCTEPVPTDSATSRSSMPLYSQRAPSSCLPSPLVRAPFSSVFELAPHAASKPKHSKPKHRHGDEQPHGVFPPAWPGAFAAPGCALSGAEPSLGT